MIVSFFFGMPGDEGDENAHGDDGDKTAVLLQCQGEDEDEDE